MTSGRRPSLKLGTHSTSRFIRSPHYVSTLKSGDAKVYCCEIRNLTVIRNVVHRDVCLLSRFDGSDPVLPANLARCIDRGSADGFGRHHLHLCTSQREDKLHIQGRRGSRIEVRRERNGSALVDQSATRCVAPIP